MHSLFDFSFVRDHTSVLKKGIAILTDIFVPLSFVIGGAGLIKSFVAIVTLIQIPLSASLLALLTSVSDSTYYFIPVIIAVSTARRLEVDLFIATILGCILLYPNISSQSYAYSVLPSILSVVFLRIIYNWLKILLPKSVEYIVVSGLSLLITSLLMLFIIAPFMSSLSTLLVQGMQNLYDTSGLFASIVLGLTFPLFVISGFVYALLPIVFQNIQTLGYDYLILPIMFYATVYQGIAALSVSRFLPEKSDQKLAKSVGITAILGITEPAMYQINLKYIQPFIGCVIGTLTASVLVYLLNIRVYFIAGTGIISLFGFLTSQTVGNIIYALCILLIGIFVTYLSTVLLITRKFKR